MTYPNYSKINNFYDKNQKKIQNNNIENDFENFFNNQTNDVDSNFLIYKSS